jgi:hypothetical protein
MQGCLQSLGHDYHTRRLIARVQKFVGGGTLVGVPL